MAETREAIELLYAGSKGEFVEHRSALHQLRGRLEQLETGLGH